MDRVALDELVALLAGGWTVEILEGPRFNAVLLPDNGDRFAPAYLIEETDGGFGLKAHRWDELRPVGVFATLEQALEPIREVALLADRAGPMRMN